MAARCPPPGQLLRSAHPPGQGRGGRARDALGPTFAYVPAEQPNIPAHLFHDSPTQQTVRGTAWAGYQAVVEYVDHYAPFAPASTPHPPEQSACSPAISSPASNAPPGPCSPTPDPHADFQSPTDYQHAVPTPTDGPIQPQHASPDKPTPVPHTSCKA